MAWAAAVQQGMGALGSGIEAESRYNTAQYDAKVALQNAAISRQQAAEDARRAMIVARKQIGDMRANYAANGVGLTGSALDVLGESAATAELDRLSILHEGESRARMYEDDARMSREVGRAARIGGYLGASGDLLGAAGASKRAAGENNSPRMRRT